MNEIRVHAVFQASSERTFGRTCEIDMALATEPLTVTVGTFDVVIEFPKFDGSWPAKGYVGKSWSGSDDSTLLALSPSHFNARTEFKLSPRLDEQAVQAELKAAVGAIRFAAARLSDALRVEQPSVGMVGEIPKMLTLTATDVTQDLTLRVMEPLNPGYAIVVGLPALTVNAAVYALKNGVSPTRALLSQARYLTQSTNSPQPGTAILLAAVAAETHAKETFKSGGPSGSGPNLRKLQEVHNSAVAHYGPIAKAMIGRSLEVDDPGLWLDLKSLFNARNNMAHKLITPTHINAGRLVVAAMKSMNWLDSGGRT